MTDDKTFQVGDRVRRPIYTGPEGGSNLPPEEGTVIYVHPLGRFYTVEFTFPARHPWEKDPTVREAYIMPRERGDGLRGTLPRRIV